MCSSRAARRRIAPVLRAARRRRAAFVATAQRLRRRCVFTGTLIAIPDVAQLAEQAESVRLPGVPEGTLG